MTITPAQENEHMLARALGIGVDEAAVHLGKTVAITTGAGEAAAFATELSAQLERTVRIAAAEGPCDLEVAIHAVPVPMRQASKRLCVALHDDGVTVSGDTVQETRTAADGHGVQRIIEACYAASVVLSRLIEGLEQALRTDPFQVSFSALGATRAVLATAVRLEDAVLVGAGAVGNGFLRAARHLDIGGTLTVVDPKVVGSGNSNRCLYFTDADVGKPKAERLCADAQGDFPHLKLAPVIGTFADLVKSRGRMRRAIITADSRRARRSIQKGLPLEVLDASTTGVSEVIVHSHRQPNPGACLACIYHHVPDELARERDIAAGLGVELADVTSGGLIDARIAGSIAAKHPGLNQSPLIGMAFDSLFKQLCAQQTLLTAAGEQVLAPFAFVSNLAGALLALELARFESGQRFRDGKNYLFTSPWAPPHAHMRRYRGRMTDCEFCAQPTAEAAWATVWPAWAQRGEGARKARSSQLCDGVDSKTLDDLRGQ
jgi:molybdopterin/thiamine biosynthesis adenylyltransferase